LIFASIKRMVIISVGQHDSPLEDVVMPRRRSKDNHSVEAARTYVVVPDDAMADVLKSQLGRFGLVLVTEPDLLGLVGKVIAPAQTPSDDWLAQNRPALEVVRVDGIPALYTMYHKQFALPPTVPAVEANTEAAMLDAFVLPEAFGVDERVGDDL
jgi:hypothetical protein